MVLHGFYANHDPYKYNYLPNVKLQGVVVSNINLNLKFNEKKFNIKHAKETLQDMLPEMFFKDDWFLGTVFVK